MAEQTQNQQLGRYSVSTVRGEAVRAFLPPALPNIPTVRLGGPASAFGASQGNNLAFNIIAVFNPESAKGNSIQELLSGAFNAAWSEGAQSVTIRAVGVINTTLQQYFTKKGWHKVKIKLSDGTESEAFERTFDVN